MEWADGMGGPGVAAPHGCMQPLVEVLAKRKHTEGTVCFRTKGLSARSPSLFRGSFCRLNHPLDHTSYLPQGNFKGS